MTKLFCYGTLLSPQTQLDVLGRILIGPVETLKEHVIVNDVNIDNEFFPRLKKYPNGIVFGHIYNLTEEEVKKLDEYETDAYYRIEIKTDLGTTVQVYWHDLENKKEF